MNDLASQLCLRTEQLHMTLVPRHLPGHLYMLADHLSRRKRILQAECISGSVYELRTWDMLKSTVDKCFYLCLP